MSKSEFRLAVRHRCPMTDPECDAVFALFDLDHDGSISVEEFVTSVERGHEERKRAHSLRPDGLRGDRGGAPFWLCVPGRVRLDA